MLQMGSLNIYLVNQFGWSTRASIVVFQASIYFFLLCLGFGLSSHHEDI